MIGKELKYGLKDGKLISINEAERGLKCDCICPYCGAKLEAKKGDVRIPHFAHYQKSTCEFGYQTSLHMLAKQLISEKKMIKIPLIDCECYYEDLNEFDGYRSEKKIIREERLLENVKVYLEQKENGIIPDIIVQFGEHKLYVEIYVTHKVDDAKKQLVKQNNISMLEIDLSDVNREISEEELSKYLFEDTSKSKWINNIVYNNENNKQKKIKEDLIKKHKEDEEKKIQEIRHKRIEEGKCPNCGNFFEKYKTKDGRIIYTCYIFCGTYKTLPLEAQYKIRKQLEGKPAYNYQETYVHNGKCPACNAKLVIKYEIGKYPPFVACDDYPRCKAQIYKKLYWCLPKDLKDELNKKTEEYYAQSSNINEKNPK